MVRTALVIATVFLGISPAYAQDDAPGLTDIYLVCKGRTFGNVERSQSQTSLYGGGFLGGGYGSTDRQAEIDVVAQFRIQDGVATMNLPAAVLPDFRNARNGWLRVKDLAITPDRITGKVAYNFLQSSTFEIDRRTGIMTSAGGYQGTCEPLQATERAF